VIGGLVRGLIRWRRPRAHVAHFERVLGTSLELQCVASRRAAAAEAEKAALAEIARLERIFSIFDPESELSRWQRTLEQDVRISDELATVLEQSERWRSVTGGAFDPAVEAVRQTLEAGGDGGEGAFTDPVTRPTVGDGPRWRIVREPKGEGAIARKLAAGPLSLNGIAKGFIVDRACGAVVRVPGVTEALVNLGGDIRHLGEQGGTVGVTDPFADAENLPPVAAVRLRNSGLATSGGYRRTIVVNGTRRSHLLDPRTGSPASGVRSATAIAPSAMAADALATAFAILAPEESVRIADSVPGAACFLVLEDRGRVASAAWEEHRAA
jgi:FAD:protein FMN transferase